MKTLSLFLLGFCGMLFLSNCSDEENFPERVDKLRGVGVSLSHAEIAVDEINPQAPFPLDFVFVAPKAVKIKSYANFEITRGGVSLTVEDNPLKKPSIETVEAGPLQIITIHQQVKLPAKQLLQVLFAQLETDFARINYGLKLTTEKGDTEIMVGALVFRANPITKPKPLVVAFKGLKDSVLKSGIELEATVNRDHKRKKVVWFFSSGQVDPEHKGETTKWLPKKSGSQTILISAHDMSSFLFAYAVKTVTVK